MFRLILSIFLFFQVTNGWGHFDHCRFIEMFNCDFKFNPAGGYHGGWWHGQHGNFHGHEHGHDFHGHGHDFHGHDGHDFHGSHHHYPHGDSDHSQHRHGQWFENKDFCGSDGVTYKNRCYLVKAQCKHKITMKHEGACTNDKTDAPKQTTPEPKIVPQTTPKSPARDKFCQILLTQLCHGVNPICGTNHQSYDNECEFEKAKCADDTLHVQHLGVC